MADKVNIIEVVSKLFNYTDSRDWDKLQSEVFTTGPLHFDMSSLGGETKETTGADVFATWEKGFQGIDAVNHLGGNHVVTLNAENEAATVFCYATATHYKKDLTQGYTREFVGTYNIGLQLQKKGWRITSFQYNLKYATGNLEWK